VLLLCIATLLKCSLHDLICGCHTQRLLLCTADVALQSGGHAGLGVAGNLNVSLHFELDFRSGEWQQQCATAAAAAWWQQRRRQQQQLPNSALACSLQVPFTWMSVTAQ
jgi:hypothetical protein